MSYRIATVTINSTSPMSHSHFFKSKKPTKQTHEEFEAANWKEKAHVDEDGHIFIPPMAVKRSIDEACKRLALQIPGQGKTRYTKYIEAGAMVLTPVVISNGNGKPIHIDDVDSVTVWCDSNGVRGGGSMVKRTFPIYPQWSATFEYHVLDDVLTEEVIEKCIESSGIFVGLGRFRPQNGGYFGRFEVKSIKWTEHK